MIALITPTGGRPFQFDLCQKWMQRQTYQGSVVWFIIDDCLPLSTNMVTDDFRSDWKIFKIYPQPAWMTGQNTQSRNISAGIQTLMMNYRKEEIEAIFIIEDDDYYRANYLERMMANFYSYHLIGERNTVYYNIHWKRYIINPNVTHASLFQTAFKYDVIQTFINCIPNKFIDFVFWSQVSNKKLFYENDLAIGMKGMPGRGGIGAGHSRSMNMKDDPYMIYLKNKIGDDAKFYEGRYGNSGVAQHPLFVTKRL